MVVSRGWVFWVWAEGPDGEIQYHSLHLPEDYMDESLFENCVHSAGSKVLQQFKDAGGYIN